jgi:hypothetical protein
MVPLVPVCEFIRAASRLSMVLKRLALWRRLYQNIRRAKKYGRYPEESACRLTKKAIRRSEECACWLDCLLPGHEDESRLEAVPLVKKLWKGIRYTFPNLMTN